MDVQTATVVVAGISVVIGVINSILSRRRAETQRQTEMFMELYHRFIDKDHLTAAIMINDADFKDFKELRNSNIKTRVEANMVGRYFEGIGVLLRRGLIDVSLIHELLSIQIIRWWEKMGPIIQEVRRSSSWRTMYDHAEFLYHEMKQREQQSPLIPA